MIELYTNFQSLVPATSGKGAAHRGEDGRFVETLIRDLLAKYLPKELEVLTGFIIKPAVKCDSDKSRKNEEDDHSTQLDIIIYNTARYPVFMRYGDTALVPPEGVISIISVKKTLSGQDIAKESKALRNAARLCMHTNLRPPFLSIISMDSNISKRDVLDWIFKQLKNSYTDCNGDDKKDLAFDETIGYIGAIRRWSIFKKRPKRNLDEPPYKAEYIAFKHEDATTYQLPIQFLLTGILSVYYDKSRNTISRPGFTGFPSNQKCINLGCIDVQIPAIISK